MRITVFCDIDGVLADCTHRLHYAKSKNYDKFYSAEELAKDTLIYAGYELIRTFILSGADIHYITGRNVSCSKATLEWLRQQSLPTNGCLAMRRQYDYRPSPIVKPELIKATYDRLAEVKKDVWETQDMHSTYFIDDDPENVKSVCATFPHITGITFGIDRMWK